MNYNINNKSLEELKSTQVYFTFEFYKQKPHWDSQYYDVLSGCKDTFEKYRNKVLKDKIIVKAVFELQDIENATFRINFKDYNVNPVEIAYVKIIDSNNIFQGKSWANTYFFINNVKFHSLNVATLYGQLDFWMTYWEQFKFNGNLVKCIRKHMPRYRTDEKHFGEFDFSTDSAIINVDQIEAQFTNLVSSEKTFLFTDFNNKLSQNDIICSVDNSFDLKTFVYCLAVPKDDDSVMITPPDNPVFEKVGDIIKKNHDQNALPYLFLDDTPDKNQIYGCPWFVFSLSWVAQWAYFAVNLKNNTKQGKLRNTFYAYSFWEMSFLGDRIVNIFYVDHPIFYYKPSDFSTFSNPVARNIVFISGVSNNIPKQGPDVEEIVCYTSQDFDNQGWAYSVDKDKFNFDVYKKPLKTYTKNDSISLDQEPALFRTPHFEFEYSFYTAKGVLKIQNELVLSEGSTDNYGKIFCDYIIHGSTLLKYFYTKDGWYEPQYKLWKYGLFEENSYSFDLLSEAYQNFLLTQQSQFNNSYLQSNVNSILGVVESGIGLALGIGSAFATGGLSIPIGLGLGASGMSVLNSSKNLLFNHMSRQAQIQDLQRTPATRVNASNSFSNTTFKQITNRWDKEIKDAKGMVCIRRHRENEQWILFYHFHQHGYLVNKMLSIKNLDWFNSREWFDFFQIEEFTSCIDNTKYNQYILGKFNGIFQRGIRLWHYTENFLNYKLNNKEINDWKKIHLKK